VSKSASKIRAPAVGAVLLQSMAGRWDAFGNQVARARKNPTERTIHDLRVATRRLIATLDIVGTALPGGACRRSRRQLKRYLRAFSTLRDLQVQIIAVRELAVRFPFLQPFLTVLMVRETLLVKRSRREVFAIQMTPMEREVSAAGHRLESLLADPVMADAARSAVLGALGSAFVRAGGLKAGAMTGKTNRIHRFRIAFKRFRYTLEALQPLLHDATGEVLKAMNRYQVMMGEIQDVDVLESMVSIFARRRARSAPVQSLRLKEHLADRRKDLITRFIASAGEFDRFWRDSSPPGC